MPKINTNLLKRVTASGEYLPYIDGLRFLSITMVVLFHFFDYYRDKAYPYEIADEVQKQIMKFTTTGYAGVMLFFGISGFVLGMPFIKQHLYGGKKVKIKDYLLRRLTRLEPPYIIVITLLFVLSLLRATKGDFTELFPHYLASFFYSHNVIYDGFPVLSDVLWSLEVEVQFYLLAPLFALIFKLNKYIRRIILLFIILFYTEHIRSAIDPFPFFWLIKFIQYFMAGFLAADLFFEYKDKIKSSYMFDIVSVYSIISLWLAFDDVPLSFKVFLIIASTPFTVFWKKFLSLEWITIIGGMCYTIYMLHQRILHFVLGNFKPKEIIADNVFIDVSIRVLVYLIPLTILCFGFFIFVERPTMKRQWWKYRSFKKLFFE